MSRKIIVNSDVCAWKNGGCECDCDCNCTTDGKGSCVGCAEVCPEQAITRAQRVIVDHGKCVLCGACIDACPYNAIAFTDDLKLSI